MLEEVHWYRWDGQIVRHVVHAVTLRPALDLPSVPAAAQQLPLDAA